MSSETKRLLDKDNRPIEKIDERLEDDEVKTDTVPIGVSQPPGPSVLAKIRRRQSPPDYGLPSTKYGTLDTSAGMKRSLLVDTYPRTHITRKQFTIAFIAFLIFAGAVAVTLVLGLPRLDAKRSEYYAAQFYSSPIEQKMYHQRAVLVTGSPECARVGQSVLERQNGSTAMDAALAALFCSVVTSPHLTRFDSGISAIYYRNGSGYSIQSLPSRTELPENVSISNPTLVRTAELLHRRFGNLAWTQILEPSIQLATNGAPVTKALNSLLNAKHLNLLNQSLSIQSLFQTRGENNTQVPLEPGDLFRISSLGKTLNSIAINGSSELTNGTLFQKISSDLQSNLKTNESISLSITDSVPKIEALLNISLLNGSLHLLTVPPPSSGVVLSQMISILERIVMSNESAIELCNDDNRTLKEGAYEFHYMIEALKFGFASLSKLSSSQTFSSNPQNSSSSIIESLLSPDQIEEIVQKILDFSQYSEAEHSPGYYGIDSSKVVIPENQGSTGAQIIVYDGSTGDVVTLSTLNQNDLFDGEKILSESTGIILDKSSSPNQPDPITYQVAPVLFVDSASKSVRLASTGSGPESLAGLVQVLYKIFYNCQELKSATDESRFYYNAARDQIQYEASFPQAYIDLLTKMFGHYNMRAISGKAEPEKSQVFTIYHLNQYSTCCTAFHNDSSVVHATNNVTNIATNSTTDYKLQLVSMTDYRAADGYSDGD